MAWCEFLLKSFAYQRMEKDKMRHTRLIAYSAQVGAHLDPKRIPKSLEDFIKIDGKRGVSEETKQKFQRRLDEFYSKNISG